MKLVGLLVLASSAVAVTGPAVAASRAVAAPNALQSAMLASHNSARQAVGVRDLQWDPGLASAAARYAAELAATGRWGHSAPEARPNQGENLWMGTRGAFTPTQMVGHWVDEKSMYRPGIFPNVSTSGSWQDVAHYTQIIWAGTQRVGCAIGSSADTEYLVCRYSNAGNVYGQLVAPTRFAAR